MGHRGWRLPAGKPPRPGQKVIGCSWRGTGGWLPLAFKSVVEQLYTLLVTVAYSNLVSEKACIAAIERTPTYWISAGDLQRKEVQVAIVGHLPLWELDKARPEQSSFNGVPSSESLLSAVWQARGMQSEPAPLVPTTAFSCLTLECGK